MMEVYDQCTTFMIHCANLLGVTYRDTNAMLFFVLWPATTVGLIGWVGWNSLVLRRLTDRLNTQARSATPEQHKDGVRT